MKRRTFCLTVLMACCTGSFAAADDVFQHPVSAEQLLRTTLAAPAAELLKAQVLSGQFVQRRQFTGVPRPAVSKGEFLLARDQSVYWHTQTPFDTVLVLTREGMSLRDGTAGGTRTTTREQPALRMAVEIFFAMFSLDVQQLQKHFELYGLEKDGRWQVGLRPKQKNMTAVFRQAVVEGANYVDRIELTDAQGDKTEIELSNAVARSTPLTAEERARFK